jgi:DNA-binding Lrp family transcriptional regulator
MNWNGVKIDPLAQEMLRIIEREGRSVTTSRFRELTDASNSSVNYRYGQLEKAGLITVSKANTGPSHLAASNQASLTKAGRRFVKERPFDVDEETVQETLERHDRQDSSLNRRLDEQREQIDELEETVSNFVASMESIEDDVEYLKAGYGYIFNLLKSLSRGLNIGGGADDGPSMIEARLLVGAITDRLSNGEEIRKEIEDNLIRTREQLSSEIRQLIRHMEHRER